MKTRIKYIIAVSLSLGFLLLFFLFTAYKNRFTTRELFAPVIVNIEADKLYANSFVVITESNHHIFNLFPTSTDENDLQNTVICSEIYNLPIQKLFVKCGKDQSVINGIDNITLFVGNKMYYYAKDIIKTWEQTGLEDGILLNVPVQPYTKSVMGEWINWYGDLNFALQTITACFTNPLPFFGIQFQEKILSFLIIFLLILIFSVLYSRKQPVVDFIKINSRKMEITGLVLLLLFAFLLRINGLTRYSSWYDELYSSAYASNPNLPFINTFKDPGNPPLFFILLRLWFEIFGWSEPSGRMLSVVIGMFSILTLYHFVKMICGKKCALFAAFLLTVNPSHISFSNEIRAYTFQMALVPLVAHRFLLLIQKDNIKNYLFYILVSVLLVNTHYFGVLLICFNFIYYIVSMITAGFNKESVCKKTARFMAANLVIAASLLPFFIITAFKHALIDSNFNIWIPKPEKRRFALFAACLLFCCIFPAIKRFSKTIKKISLQSNNLVDYAVYACSFIVVTSFVVSLKRPILVSRYLSICLPLLFSALPVFVFNTVPYGKFSGIIRFVLIMAILNFACVFRIFGGGNNDIYKEAQEYICADIQAHSFRAAYLCFVDIQAHSSRTAYLCFLYSQMSYYKMNEIDVFSQSEDYDVVYVNPLHFLNETPRLQLLFDAGLDQKNILRIRTTLGKNILKKYLSKYD